MEPVIEEYSVIGSFIFKIRNENTMNSEFLQNFKVGDAPLPKEIIDAILAENDRDVTAAVKPYADYEAIKEQLTAAKDGLKAFEGVDVKDLQGQVAKLTQDLKAKEAEHQAQLSELEFDGVLKDAITAAKGRSVKAVRAMLDVDTLRASKNRETDIRTALESLKKESGYLFESEETPPPYAAGTGTQPLPGGSDFNFGFTGVRAPAATGK